MNNTMNQYVDLTGWFDNAKKNLVDEINDLIFFCEWKDNQIGENDLVKIRLIGDCLLIINGKYGDEIKSLLTGEKKCVMIPFDKNNIPTSILRGNIHSLN